MTAVTGDLDAPPESGRKSQGARTQLAEPRAEAAVAPAPRRSEGAELGEILLPIDGSSDCDGAADYAVALATRLPAKVLLMWVTPRVEVPPQLLEFARVEKVRDIEAVYLDGLGREAMRRLGERLDEAGIEYRRTTYVGSLRSAVEAYGSATGVVMTVLPARYSRLGGFLSLGRPRIARLSAPTLVVSNHIPRLRSRQRGGEEGPETHAPQQSPTRAPVPVQPGATEGRTVPKPQHSDQRPDRGPTGV